MRFTGLLFAVRSGPRLVPKPERVVRVAVVGVPNAGKSTLINSIVERRICAASSKVHTTKTLSRAICTSDNTQIVFLDTPGIVNAKETKKYGLHKCMEAAYSSLRQADIIGVIHDVSNPYLRASLHKSIIEALKKNNNIPSFLVLNKIDVIKSKRMLLDLVRILSNNKMAGIPISNSCKSLSDAQLCRGYDGFSDVFMISALESDGTDAIKEYLIRNSKPEPWTYTDQSWTDQTPETLIIETVRAKLLDFLPQEIPYNLNTEIEYLENHEDKMTCGVVVNCPSERITKLISGAGGGKLHQISTSARGDLVQMFQKSVSLSIELRNINRNS